MEGHGNFPGKVERAVGSRKTRLFLRRWFGFFLIFPFAFGFLRIGKGKERERKKRDSFDLNKERSNKSSIFNFILIAWLIYAPSSFFFS